MKSLVGLFLLVFAFVSIPVQSAVSFEPQIVKSKHFESLKLYSEKDFVLKDALEFSIFDMSDIKFINNSTVSENFNALKEVNTVLESFPKHFYANLKNQIIEQRVPVTLYSDASPSYTKPLKLYIKIKRIHLAPRVENNDGTYTQPLSLRIYGQIKDKKNDQTLVKFYDSAQAEFVLGGKDASLAVSDLTMSLMKNLSLYLRTKY